jgi:uncharacterized protein (TIGR03437 family)
VTAAVTSLTGSLPVFVEAPSVAWLSASLSSSTTPATLSASVQPGTKPGLYSTVLNIRSTGAAKPVPIRIDAVVTATTTVISSVSNSASGSAIIAPQTFFSVYGSNLSSATTTWENFVRDGALPTEILGTKVSVNGRPAYISYISPTQINFIVPSGSLGSSVPVTVTTSQGSATRSLASDTQSPALFTNLWGGRSYATATIGSNLVGPLTAIPGRTVPAKRGDTVVLWATGLGPTTPLPVDGRVITPPYPQIQSLTSVNVAFGSAVVHPLFAGMTFAGVFQVNVTIPQNAPTGDIPISLQIAGAQTQSNVFISVQ